MRADGVERDVAVALRQTARSRPAQGFLRQSSSLEGWWALCNSRRTDRGRRLPGQPLRGSSTADPLARQPRRRPPSVLPAHFGSRPDVAPPTTTCAEEPEALVLGVLLELLCLIDLILRVVGCENPPSAPKPPRAGSGASSSHVRRRRSSWSSESPGVESNEAAANIQGNLKPTIATW